MGIYYKLDKNYNLYELNSIMRELQKDFRDNCLKEIEQKILIEFLYYYHLLELHGEKYIKKEKRRAKKNGQQFRVNIYNALLRKRWRALYDNV